MPRSSRDRQAIVAAIEELSRESLVAADKLMAIVGARRSHQIKAGQKAAQRRGVHCGRPKTTLNRNQVIVLHLRGKSVRQIAAELNVSRGAIQRVLETPAPARSCPGPKLVTS